MDGVLRGQADRLSGRGGRLDLGADRLVRQRGRELHRERADEALARTRHSHRGHVADRAETGPEHLRQRITDIGGTPGRALSTAGSGGGWDGDWVVSGLQKGNNGGVSVWSRDKSAGQGGVFAERISRKMLIMAITYLCNWLLLDVYIF